MSQNPQSETPGTQPVGKCAVVLGASMAGLCAARVLAERFESVIIVERDALPDQAEPRRLVPQARHPHLLLNAGARLLEGWFPGIADELQAHGAIDIDICGDVVWHQTGGRQRRPVSDLRGPAMSRPLLEWTVRKRVQALPNVEIQHPTAAEGLAFDSARGRITGVRVAGRTPVESDLVVDATGRPARSLAWLQDLGYEPPPMSVVHVDTRYVTRIYRRTDQPTRDWKATAVIGDPSSKRLAMLLPIEADRWILTIAGLNGESAPTEAAEMLAYARTLESPVIAEVMEVSEPLGDAVTHHFPSSQRRHVQRLRRFPVGWILLGDAVCSFDPIYGQGMTSAAQQAHALGRELDRLGKIDRAFARSYFRAAARIVNTPWSIAVGGDFAYEGTSGKKPFGTDILNRYMDRIVKAGQHDDQVVIRMNEVAGLLRSPQSLMAPGFMLRVLRAARRREADESSPRAQAMQSAPKRMRSSA